MQQCHIISDDDEDNHEHDEVFQIIIPSKNMSAQILFPCLTMQDTLKDLRLKIENGMELDFNWKFALDSSGRACVVREQERKMKYRDLLRGQGSPQNPYQVILKADADLDNGWLY